MERYLTGNEVIANHPIKPFQLLELVERGLTPRDPKDKKAVLIISEEQYDYLHEKGEVPEADRCLTSIIRATHEALIRKDMELGDAIFFPDLTEHHCLVFHDNNDTRSRLLEFVYSEVQLVRLLEDHGLQFAEVHTIDKHKNPRRRAEVTQTKAANECGVCRRTIQNWESGKNSPPDYPGRSDFAVFMIWSRSYRQQKELKREARAKNRAISTDARTIGRSLTKNNLAD